MGTSIETGFKLAFICGLHALVFGMLATPAIRPQLDAALSRLDVRVIEERIRPQAAQVKPAPSPARPAAPARAQPASPPAVMTSAAEVPATAQSFAVAPQPGAPVPAPAAKIETAAAPAPAQAPAAPAPAVTPARFDANYLHNPAPAYPRASRVAGQQGQVMLKVLVSDQGSAVSVQVQRSSGFARLDDAALDTVRQWRFVPAKRGAEAIEDWVLVPITFRLDA
jgi:protein TonB